MEEGYSVVQTEQKKLAKAVLRGFDMLKEHNLDDWTIQLNKKVRSLGETYYGLKTIKYSEDFLLVATKEQFDGVTKHEIAHALLPVGVHHGSEFVRKCKEINTHPDYIGRKVKPIGLSKYKIVCPWCETESLYNKKKQGFCNICLKEDREIYIETERNIPKVTVW